MSISMYSASVPVFTRILDNALAWLERAEAHAAERSFSPDVYMTLRLAPDMLPFPKQVQIACDAAKLGVARLGGIDAPSHPDTEASLGDLRARIASTLDFIGTVQPSQIDGSEARTIHVPRRGDTMVMTGETYLTYFALPNFFFHMTTLYGLLRHSGVPLGKADFLGRPPA